MPRWTEPAWRSEAEAWIQQRLEERGDSLIAPIEHSHVRPWGTAARVPTDKGLLWFKANIAPLAYEVPLLEAVAARRPNDVPRIAASDATRGWLLLEDAGAILNDAHPDGIATEIWQEFLRTYAQLQIDLAPSADELVGAGVPDRRLPHLVPGFRRILDNDALVRPATADALTDDELDRLRSLLPKLDDAVDTLAALELPDSVQHDDLHQWNVCVRDGEFRIIDWGDACISQPLLSIWVPIEHMEDADPDAVRDAYLEPWAAVRPLDELIGACDAAMLLAQITGALKWELISSAVSDDERAGYEDAVPFRLRLMLEFTCA